MGSDCQLRNNQHQTFPLEPSQHSTQQYTTIVWHTVKKQVILSFFFNITFLTFQVAMRTGGEQERRQEEDGGREGRQENMTAERDSGKEEAISTLSLVLTATMEDPRTRAVLKRHPEVDRPPAEGQSGRLRGDIIVELDVRSLLISSVMSRFILPSPPSDGRSLLHQEHNSTPNRGKKRRIRGEDLS
ncbi:hypothetical protein EYF80_066187 [Liparis tanakae]|uniref:Uncharacterized protein n=1 Tax=Liparis tanakae TaxID=230148 RepID=A0A4Z2E4M7_9TELE|nr:hypothetical protein EYF80_066187 [Liparis tanakae]